MTSRFSTPTSLLRFFVLPALLAFALVLAGCDDDPVSENGDPGDPDPTVTASFTIDPENPEVGEEVTLDGGNSTVQNAGSLSFEWSLTAPSGSNADIADPSDEITTFTADAEGDYDVTLEVSANGATDSASESVTAIDPVANTEELSSDITSDRTLVSETLYTVTSSIDIEATLTIEPGTTIEFEQGTGFTLPTSTGALVADGTEDEPILFTATSEQAGWWDGIYVRSSGNALNQLNWVTVEYGGGADFRNSGSGNVVVGRQFGGDSSIDITNSVLRNSETHGLWVRSNGDVPTFENNTLTDNEDAPVNIGSNHTHRLDAASSYTGNDEDYVRVRGGHDIDDEDVTWENLDVDYRLSSSTVEVNSGVTLTIEPGATLEFEQGGHIELDEQGGLVADGTEDEPILFTATSEQAGWWDGIYVRSSDNANNQLNWVTVEYGGGEDFRNSGPGNVVVGRQFGGNSSIDITNSVLRNSETHGLWVRSNGTVNDDACDVNTFEDNGDDDCVIN